MLIKTLCLFLFSLIVCSANAQVAEESNSNDDVDQPTSIIEQHNHSGFLMGNFRDFGTSPLFYRGAGLNFGQLNRNFNGIREHTFDLDFSGSIHLASTPNSSYFKVITESYFFSVKAKYNYLHVVPKWQTEKTTFLLGGGLIATQNARITPALMNASAGLESLFNLTFSGKFIKDRSRLSSREINFLFFSKTLQPIKREMVFQIDLGVLNLNHRPGYAYVYNAEIYGSEHNGLLWLLEPYEWSLNGWRLSTIITFSKIWQSGNGSSWSYLWDVMTVPGKHEPLNIATHKIRYSLIINKQKK